MTASLSDINRWFDNGVTYHRDFMIVMCDTYEYDNYPVYCSADEFDEVYEKKKSKPMQSVQEVYDLSLSKDAQLAQARTRNLPKGSKHA